MFTRFIRNTRIYVLLLSCFFGALYSDDSAGVPEAPWLSGPLIAPAEEAVPWGNVELEMYVFANVVSGTYTSDWKTKSTPNFYSLNPQLYVYVGVLPFMDIQLVPQFFSNWCEDSYSTQFGDLSVAIDIQLIDPWAHKWFPGIKFSVAEKFPSGKYQNGGPHMHRTDLVGGGSYQTSINLLFYKVLHIIDHHFLSQILSFSYSKESSVYVHGFNVYGGGYGTSGRVYPGDTTQIIYSFEFTFDKHWAFAMDNVYTHVNKTPFKGRGGYTDEGTLASVSFPSSEQFSLAPAIEYNLNATYSAIGGVYFSVLGRNALKFLSGVVAFEFNY